MHAHPNEQLRLLELAQLDADHQRLQHVAKNMPEQQHLVQIEEDRRVKRAAAAAALGALEDAQAELHRIQNDAKLVTERRAIDEQRLSTATSTKDIAALDTELQALARRFSELEDRELGQLDEVERLTGEHDVARDAMTEIEALAADLLERRELARNHLRDEAKQLHERRQSVVASIPAELVTLYEQRRAAGGVGAAELVGTVSSATNEVLDPAELTRIRALAPDELAFCPVSGAILVRTARSSLPG